MFNLMVCFNILKILFIILIFFKKSENIKDTFNILIIIIILLLLLLLFY